MIRSLSFVVFIVGALILGASLASAQDVDSLLADGVRQLQEGAPAGDAARVQSARARFERAIDAGPRAALSHYYVGLADYRLIDLVDDEERSEDVMDDAQKHLEQAVELRPEWAEAHALLASVYGRKASQGMFSGMRYGPRAQRAMETATSLAPENPRVLLLDAISLYNTPERWGGDKDKAIEQLHAALDQFEDAAPSDPLAPQWGHADAYAWLGIAHLEAGRTDAARAALEKALEVRAGYAWVEQVLLPKVAAAQ